MTSNTSNQPLWTPDSAGIGDTNLSRFAASIEQQYQLTFKHDYRRLHRWSIEHPDDFWQQIVQQFELQYSGELTPSSVSTDAPPFALWFPDMQLNYAENMLRWPAEWTAIIEAGEAGEGRHWNFGELRQRVARHQAALRTAGIAEGACVAGILPNTAESLAAMLAAASLGAVWASVSPDFGVSAALDRLGQVKPHLLYVVGSYQFGGKRYQTADNVAQICAQLDSLHTVVQMDAGDADTMNVAAAIPLQDFLPAHYSEEPTFTRVPFAQPLFILFTSGTTGAPKCIVHSHGGTLLQLTKEHQLHCEVRPRDRIVFPSTLGWMMWNWSISALASGACVVLYEGSLMAPDETSIFQLADSLQIAVLGLPSAFIERCRQQDIRIHSRFPLADLRLIFAGGSVLSPEGFEYVYEAIAPGIHLTTGSGGTDIISCFMLGNAWQPVWAGEMQGPALGMDVHVFDEDGKAIVGEQGELVCCAPAPSMPVRFANDPDDKRFFKSYFAAFPGIWTHGDFAEETTHGGFIIHGRSDAVLNPGGVRIGTAEIYRQVQKIPEIIDSVVAGQNTGSDVRVVLFVVLESGHTLDDTLRDRIRHLLRENASPRHVPKLILQVPDIPKTRSGKIAETAVSALINGRQPSQVHALANPDSLAHFRNRPELALKPEAQRG